VNVYNWLAADRTKLREKIKTTYRIVRCCSYMWDRRYIYTVRSGNSWTDQHMCPVHLYISGRIWYRLRERGSIVEIW